MNQHIPTQEVSFFLIPLDVHYHNANIPQLSTLYFLGMKLPSVFDAGTITMFCTIVPFFAMISVIYPPGESGMNHGYIRVRQKNVPHPAE